MRLTSHSLPAVHEGQSEEEHLCMGEDFLCWLSVIIFTKSVLDVHTRTRVVVFGRTCDVSTASRLPVAAFSPTIMSAVLGCDDVKRFGVDAVSTQPR